MEKYTLIFFLFIAQLSYAQQGMDFSHVVTPEGQTPRQFEDYLVQLAWYNSPENLVFKREVDIRTIKTKQTYWEWLRDANVSLNLNEGNLTSSEENENLFFPRYNLGITFNLGAIASRPGDTKIAKEELKIVQLEEQQKMLAVRANVLARYQDHELAVEILKSKTQAAQEASSLHTLISERFEDDKVDFKDFSAASKSKYSADEELAVAKTNVKKAVIALEEVIGIKWEKALKRRKKK